MATARFDLSAHAKRQIGDWIEDLRIGGAALPPATKQRLLAELASADLVRSADGVLELVLPALSSLGVGIFRRSFRCDSLDVRVVPYGNC
jgi:hypothetical protein